MQLASFLSKKLHGFVVKTTSIQSTKDDDILEFCEYRQNHPIPADRHLPIELREMETELIASVKTEKSSTDLMNEIVQFLKSEVFYSVDELTANKAKAIYVGVLDGFERQGLIPSCDELIEQMKKEKKRTGNAMLALETQLEASSQSNTADFQSANDFTHFKNQQEKEKEKENGIGDEEEDYSTRLGIADHVSSLEHLQRKSGVQLSPWLWFGSLATDLTKASIDRYPDMIATNMTIRWECPVCRQVLYVTREELMNHLSACVK